MPSTSNISQNDTTRSLLWLAGAVGTTVGVASWAYSRRKRSRWENARRQLGQLVDRTEDLRPWMLAGAGAAVGGTALAYRRSRRNQSSWEQAKRRSGEILSGTKKELAPWMSVATSAAISLATAAYNRRNQAKGRIADTASVAGDQLVDAGTRILDRVKRIAQESRGLYPRVRQLIA